MSSDNHVWNRWRLRKTIIAQSSTEFLFCLFFLVFSRSSDSSFFSRGVQFHQLFSLHPSPVVNSQIVHHSCHIYFLLNIHGVNREKKKMVPRNCPTFLLVRPCISNKNALVGYIPCYLLVEILIPILHIVALTSKLFLFSWCSLVHSLFSLHEQR